MFASTNLDLDEILHGDRLLLVLVLLLALLLQDEARRQGVPVLAFLVAVWASPEPAARASDAAISGLRWRGPAIFAVLNRLDKVLADDAGVALSAVREKGDISSLGGCLRIARL
jgi:hypothetical protein